MLVLRVWIPMDQLKQMPQYVLFAMEMMEQQILAYNVTTIKPIHVHYALLDTNYSLTPEPVRPAQLGALHAPMLLQEILEPVIIA